MAPKTVAANINSFINSLLIIYVVSSLLSLYNIPCSCIPKVDRTKDHLRWVLNEHADGAVHSLRCARSNPGIPAIEEHDPSNGRCVPSAHSEIPEGPRPLARSYTKASLCIRGQGV